MCYTENLVSDMLDFLVDNIFITYGVAIFQQQVDIPICTNYATLTADLFLYSLKGLLPNSFLDTVIARKILSFL